MDRVRAHLATTGQATGKRKRPKITVLATVAPARDPSKGEPPEPEPQRLPRSAGSLPAGTGAAPPRGGSDPWPIQIDQSVLPISTVGALSGTSTPASRTDKSIATAHMGRRGKSPIEVHRPHGDHLHRVRVDTAADTVALFSSTYLKSQRCYITAALTHTLSHSCGPTWQCH